LEEEMNIKEGVCVTTTHAKKKLRRTPGYWNWTPLLDMIAECLETGEEQRGSFEGTYYAVVKPEYGIIDEKQTEEYKAAHEKVRVCLYNLAFTLTAEKGETVRCPQEKLEPICPDCEDVAAHPPTEGCIA
jgi:hypothetical protein